jgi:16S rRNA (guanine527-N7)-methyltransferase
MSPDPLTTTFRQRLLDGARALGIELDAPQADALLRLLAELGEWNRAYNLTAVTEPAAMLTHHLLDSIAASPDLHGTSVADVGTGAGFPGLPLAILHPARRFTLIDSVAKKIRFVTHCIRVLGLANVAAVHGRAEQLAAAGPFDTVIARACAALPELLRLVGPLCGPQTRVVALKGRYPAAEVAALPPEWLLEASRAVVVPGLDAERHVLRLVRRPPGDAAPGPAAAGR